MAQLNGHEYVDLKLPSGVLWSKYDYGSSSETSAGGTYTWYSGTEKYNPDISNSNFDGRTVLELQDDIVNKNWGGNWCIPTKAQFEELIRYCSISGSDSTNKNYREYSSQGNSIKFPGKNSIYWANELRDQQYAYVLYNDSDYDDGDYDWYEDVDYFLKTNSYRIRPVWVPSLQHTVNVYDEDGSLVYTETLNRGDLFSYNPTKENCEFLGFFDENKVEYSTLFSVNKDLNLTIKWYNHNDYETVNGYSYVDLGLPSGTLWATMNIGATSIFDPGTPFAWGETETKESFNKSNYKWIKNELLTKYNIDEQYGIVDNKMNLDLEDDVAHVQWGDTWTLPTSVFVQELRDNCRIEYFNLYIKLTSNINNKSIYFFNNGEYNNYLTSQNSSYLNNQTFTTNTNYFYVYSSYMYSGQFVRPIIKKKLDLCTITYKDGDNILFTDQIQYGNSYLILQENPTKEGYSFRDWLINGESSISYKSYFAVDSDTELIARWNKLINITLIGQNDEIAKIISVSEDDYIYLPHIMVNAGYFSYEYNTKKDGSGEVYDMYNSKKYTEDIILYVQCKELNTEWVDFNLPSKTLWGKCNIGSISETKYDWKHALNFWFGDPFPENNRNFLKDYKYTNGESTDYGYTKYTLDDQIYNGIWYDENQNFIGDGKSVMDLEDDPAYVYLGNNWRTPTKEQWEELFQYCNFIYDNSASSNKFVSKTDPSKFIYLPNTYSHYTSGGNYLVNTLNQTNSNFYVYTKRESYNINTYNRNYTDYLEIRPVKLPYSITYKNGNFEFIDYGVEFTIKNPGWIDSKKYITSFNTEPNGSGTTYNIGDVITLEEDLTLYAQWKDKPILYIVPEEGKILTVYCEPGESVTLEKSYWDKYHNCIGYTTQKDSIEVEYKVGYSITINEDTILYVIWEDLTNGVEYIDLGLPSGNLWAVSNIPGYYSWGEVETKSVYNTNNYKHSISSWNNLNKYNQSKYYCKTGGLIDRKNILELIDDVANVQLKSDWHIPSKDDWQELINLCNWEYTNDGVKITYKDSQDCLYLPLTGNSIDSQIYNKHQAFYWSKDLNKKLSAEAFALFFNHDNKRLISTSRFSGLCIRPVIKIINDIPVNPNPPEDPVEPEKPEVPDFPEEIPETEDEFTAKIGTYNVRYWNGESDPNNQGKIAWPNRRDKVFEFLMNEGIWGVQEVTSVMYSDFINKDGYKYIGYGRGNGLSNEKASGEQIGIFYNTSKYQILNQGSFFYNKQDRSSFNRLCVWVKVQNLINGKKFYIFNNHLAHDSKEVRINQINTLLSKVSEIAKDEKVFIIGDFNSTSDSEEYQKVTDIYKDSFVLVDEPQGPNITYTGLYSTTDTNQKRIDYIYTNVESIETYKVDDDNKGLEKYPSDHYPVVVTFKF